MTVSAGTVALKIIYEGLLLMLLSIMVKTELLVQAKKKTNLRQGLECKKTSPIYDQHGRKRYPIYDQSECKTIPSRTTHTRI